ncbi:MAG: hypothetical protein RBT61_09785, partial [Candidatus Kapabacteria bacterium]|nr:hypothetical protein [Candidatus Kapabacteria bacterium]
AGFAALIDAAALAYQMADGNTDPISLAGHAATATGISYLGFFDFVGGAIIEGVLQVGAAIASFFF